MKTFKEHTGIKLPKEIAEKYKEGDRVFSYGFGYKQHNGTIHKNTEYPEVSEWYIKYDDGEDCAVLDINCVYKLDS
jgi:hypothetical protein